MLDGGRAIRYYMRRIYGQLTGVTHYGAGLRGVYHIGVQALPVSGNKVRFCLASVDQSYILGWYRADMGLIRRGTGGKLGLWTMKP
jgi:hypothetical protein